MTGRPGPPVRRPSGTLSVPLVLAGLIAMLWLPGCGRPPVIDDPALATAVDRQLIENGVPDPRTSCAGPVPAESGKSVRCSFVGQDGTPVDILVTIRETDGTTATFDLTAQERPLDRDGLARSLTAALGADPSGSADDTSCDHDLQLARGSTATCVVTRAGETFTVTVTTTGVTDGEIDYQYAVARPAQ